jgi:acetate kinase
MTAASSGQAAAGSSGGLVLVLNSGSSSVKFALLLPGSGERLMGGSASGSVRLRRCCGSSGFRRERSRNGFPEALTGLSWPGCWITWPRPGGNERARLALEVFVHRLSTAIAGLVVGLQRLDALVFTGGIGENSAVVRSLVLSRLGFLGLAEDVDANADHGRRTGGRISVAGPVPALVVPTDEELMIARDTAHVIAGS